MTELLSANLQKLGAFRHQKSMIIKHIDLVIVIRCQTSALTQFTGAAGED